MDTMLPQQFMELSLNSLKRVQLRPFQLNQQNFQQLDNFEEQTETLRVKLQPICLTPKNKGDIATAVDTSTIKLGETRTGILIAIRGANIWKQKANYRYLRCGPFIFHITEDNKKDFCARLQRACLGQTYSYIHQIAPGLPQMPIRIASMLERWLQAMLCKTVNNGMILFDGSLVSGTPDSPTRHMKEILQIARENNSIVLAFSKMTHLRANGYVITDLLPKHKPPYLLETTGLRIKAPAILLGDVYVARLTKGKYAFRLDIDKEVMLERRISAVERLLGTDSFCQSYPETLRLAHILCTFTANEVLAMQHFIATKCGLQMVNRPDMHRLLFGPFGKGEYCS